MAEAVTIRKMTVGDWPGVRRIYRAGIDSGRATVLVNCPDYDEWDRAHTPDLRFVAERDAQVIGFIAGMPVSIKPAYHGVVELSVYVDTACHRQGVGRLLIETMIDESERRGVWTLQAVVICDNLPSIHLHEACGFRLVGRREMIARDKSGAWKDTLLYERRSKKIL